jgi:hypothetical protein
MHSKFFCGQSLIVREIWKLKTPKKTTNKRNTRIFQQPCFRLRPMTHCHLSQSPFPFLLSERAGWKIHSDLLGSFVQLAGGDGEVVVVFKEGLLGVILRFSEKCCILQEIWNSLNFFLSSLLIQDILVFWQFIVLTWYTHIRYIKLIWCVFDVLLLQLFLFVSSLLLLSFWI